MRSFAAGFLACLLLIAAVGVVAKAMAETWLTISVASYHFKERDSGKGSYEQTNPGLGLEHVLSDKWRFGAGTYRSSIRTDASYVGAMYTPFSWSYLKFGIAMGAVSGYEPNLIPLVIPTLMVEGKKWGANILFVPPVQKTDGGGLGFQVKFKFP